MQKWILLVLAQLLAWSVYAQQKKKINFNELDVIRGLYFQPNTIKPYSGTAFDKFPNGKKRMEMKIQEGKIHGTSRQWLENGQMIFERHYNMGVAHGKETQWYVVGKKKAEVEYVNGNIEGMAREWYNNGKKESEGLFKNGKEEGEHTWWHRNGQVDQVVFFKNGKAEGLVKSWFENGIQHEATYFVAGQKNGSSKEWFDNGQPFFAKNFKAGKEDGKSQYWNKKGMLIKEELHDAGQLIESKNYLSGSVFNGSGYWQVFNELNDFFLLEISGTLVRPRRADEITYVVDGDLLQIFNQNKSAYFEGQPSNSDELKLLEKYISQESKYIQSATNFALTVKKTNGKTAQGKDFIHWHFVSPSSQAEEQKPRTVQEEHYISFICGERILSLYGAVTNNDQPAAITTMLHRIANSLEVKPNRIDLNALAASVKNKN
ncbi:MAG: toxin-antitoxin system YwqK family antitoxin [Bacteroidota bacterium]